MRVFGLELEGFVFDRKAEEMVVPPVGMPVDGFPLIAEIRTTPCYDLYDAFGKVWAQIEKLTDQFPSHNLIFVPKVKLPPDLVRKARAGREFVKGIVDVQNIYGKKPRALGNNAIASLQINISERLQEEHKDKEGVVHSARYGLLDVPRIIHALDKEFREEIKVSGRQEGEYAIKDAVRLEYRSLPNSIFFTEGFISRVRKAIK